VRLPKLRRKLLRRLVHEKEDDSARDPNPVTTDMLETMCNDNEREKPRYPCAIIDKG
jgi:hypothetical protein